MAISKLEKLISCKYLAELLSYKDANIYIHENINDFSMEMRPDTRINNKLGIHILDCNIEEYYNLFKENIYRWQSVQIIERLLINNDILTSSDKMDCITLAVFSYYHEEGHLKDYIKNYKKKGLVGEQYLEDYYKENEKIGLTKLAIECRNTNEEDIEMRKKLNCLYQKKYRENRFEMIADKYAINKIKQNKKLIRSLYNN